MARRTKTATEIELEAIVNGKSATTTVEVEITNGHADPADDQDDIAVQLATNTMTGDLRDFILDRLRHEQSKQPWHQRSEADQREVVHQVESAVRAAVTRAVEIMAGAGRRTIEATVDQITIKDGYKATLTFSKLNENRHVLADAQGARVLIVVADPDIFTGERAPVAITPDQATLLGDEVMAVHSDMEERAGNPLN